MVLFRLWYLIIWFIDNNINFVFLTHANQMTGFYMKRSTELKRVNIEN